MNKENEFVKGNIAALYGTGTSSLDGLEKSKGEGSRGGKVIGHTNSGKPIYENHSHSSHKTFTPKEHSDAAYELRKLGNKSDREGDEKDGNWYFNEAQKHTDNAKEKKSAYDVKKSETDTILGQHIKDELAIRKSQISNMYSKK